MDRARILTLTVAIAILAPILQGCSDEETATGPTAFAVTITVTDAEGAPMPGLDLSLAPETPFYGEKGADGDPENPEDVFQMRGPFPNPFNPTTVVQGNLTTECNVRLCIEDVEGTELRVLDDQVRSEGDHFWVWNGRDDSDSTLSSGIYTAHLVCTDVDDETVLCDESRTMLMAAWVSNRSRVGTSDDDGQIVLTDRRMFPFLYDVEAFSAYDENGEIIGTIELTAGMRFYLTDPVEGTVMRFNHDVTEAMSLNFTWDPVP